MNEEKEEENIVNIIKLPEYDLFDFPIDLDIEKDNKIIIEQIGDNIS